MEKIKELYVILENRANALGELLDILSKNKINIETIGVFGDSAKLLVNNVEKTKRLLEKNNYVVEIRDVLRAELQNKPGELAYLTSRLGHVGINIDYLYSAIRHGDKTAIVILDVDDIETALSLFR